MEENLSYKESTARNNAENRYKSQTVAWLLWFFLGVLGAHKFYLGLKGQGVAMLLTLGGIGFWALFSAFSINRSLRDANREILNEERRAVGLLTSG